MKDLYRAMGIRIAESRKSQKITQEVLAEKLDVTVKHISSVERGQSTLSLEKLADLCIILDVSLDYLVFGYDNSASRLPLPHSALQVFQSDNPSEIELFLEYLRLYNRLRH